jgi:aminopeptidase N
MYLASRLSTRCVSTLVVAAALWLGVPATTDAATQIDRQTEQTSGHQAHQAAASDLRDAIRQARLRGVQDAHHHHHADGDGLGCDLCANARLEALNRLGSDAIRSLMPKGEAGGEIALEAMGDTDVLHYDLEIEITNINPGGNTCTITGTNVMTIQAKLAGLDEFTFRLDNNFTITSALINGTTPITVNMLSSTTRRAVLDRAYSYDEVFELTISYTGNTTSEGFGSIDVGWAGGNPVVATLSEAFYAYTWWPAKDGETNEPGDQSDKFTMDFAIIVPAAYTVPANGILEGVDDLSGNRRRFRWSTDYPIATYLVSFAATVYNTWTEYYEYDGGSMPVEFFIYPSNDHQAYRNGWGRSVDMIAAFKPLYGEYPFLEEKYGIYNFNFGGGMEHQTMTGQGSYSESLTAHELAHQWWGDMITCETWSDIWLNEGFATWSECIWEEYKGATPNINAYFNAVDARRPWNLNTTVYVYPDEITMSRVFSSNSSYRKGCWVLHQLRGVVGTDMMFDILAAYRDAYEYSAATTDEFAAVASSVYGEDLGWFFDEWVYQSGAPSYQWGWSTATAGGKYYLLLYIRQTQGGGAPSVFTMPVKLEVSAGPGNDSVTVFNDARTEWFVIPTAQPANSVAFDPDEWILRSSLNNVGYQAGPPVLVATEPALGAELTGDDDVTEIVLTFHAAVSASAGDFSVVGDVQGPQAFTLNLVGNVATLTFADALPADNYTVKCSDAIVGTIGSRNLDGEIEDPTTPASLPSGEGEPGGDAVFQFSLATPVPGDLDNDGDVDLDDYTLFEFCMLGPDAGVFFSCDQADFAHDDDVDLMDAAEWMTLFTGAFE